jgi:neuronal cell adhesion protein
LYKTYFSVHYPPEIIKQPPTDEILYKVGEIGKYPTPFEIECEAKGEPEPT